MALVGIVLVVLGFVVKIIGSKRSKKDPSLRYGVIKSVKNAEDGYIVNVEYSPNRNEEIISTELKMKRRPGKSHLILKEEDGTVIVYNYAMKCLLISTILWVIGGLMCALA